MKVWKIGKNGRGLTEHTQCTGISISQNKNLNQWLRKCQTTVHNYLGMWPMYNVVYIPHTHSMLDMRTAILLAQTKLFCMNGLPNSIIHMNSISNTMKFIHWYDSISLRDKLCITWWVLVSCGESLYLLHFNLHECMLSYLHKEWFLVKSILAVLGIPLSHFVI